MENNYDGQMPVRRLLEIADDKSSGLAKWLFWVALSEVSLLVELETQVRILVQARIFIVN